LRRTDLLALRGILNAWQGLLRLEVGSALVSLMGDVAPAHLKWRGVHGCAAGRRICTVWPDGRVTPCSFLADLSAGNACQVSFADLWGRGEGWERLRDPSGRYQGDCADCAILSQCGGARCVARYETRHMTSERLAEDTGCPRIT
jgi:radical SAM protein with 4Fe4S-binding SPASM domain